MSGSSSFHTAKTTTCRPLSSDCPNAFKIRETSKTRAEISQQNTTRFTNFTSFAAAGHQNPHSELSLAAKTTLPKLAEPVNSAPMSGNQFVIRKFPGAKTAIFRSLRPKSHGELKELLKPTSSAKEEVSPRAKVIALKAVSSFTVLPASSNGVRLSHRKTQTLKILSQRNPKHQSKPELKSILKKEYEFWEEKPEVKSLGVLPSEKRVRFACD